MEEIGELNDTLKRKIYVISTLRADNPLIGICIPSKLQWASDPRPAFHYGCFHSD